MPGTPTELSSKNWDDADGGCGAPPRQCALVQSNDGSWGSVEATADDSWGFSDDWENDSHAQSGAFPVAQVSQTTQSTTQVTQAALKVTKTPKAQAGQAAQEAPKSPEVPKAQEAQETPVPTMWNEIKLRPEVRRAIDAAGYDTPSHIQARTIPALLNGQNVLGHGQTGTGKTLSYAVPVLQSVVTDKPDVPQALVLVPTGVLASSIMSYIVRMGKFIPGLKVATLIGGSDVRDDLAALRSAPQIIVGTLGRVLQLCKPPPKFPDAQPVLDLTHLNWLIIDEVDALLDASFLVQVQELVQNHLTLVGKSFPRISLFTATLPPPVLKVCRELLHEGKDSTTKPPLEVLLSSSEVLRPKTVKMRTIRVDAGRDVIWEAKGDLLSDLLEQLTKMMGLCIVFCNTNKERDWLLVLLAEREIMATGDLTRFKEGNAGPLIATDIISRGIDVQAVAYVINFSIPQDPKRFIHRSGRTGRFNRAGNVLTFIGIGSADEAHLVTFETTYHTKIESLKSISQTLRWLGCSVPTTQQPPSVSLLTAPTSAPAQKVSVATPPQVMCTSVAAPASASASESVDPPVGTIVTKRDFVRVQQTLAKQTREIDELKASNEAYVNKIQQLEELQKTLVETTKAQIKAQTDKIEKLGAKFEELLLASNSLQKAQVQFQQPPPTPPPPHGYLFQPPPQGYLFQPPPQGCMFQPPPGYWQQPPPQLQQVPPVAGPKAQHLLQRMCSNPAGHGKGGHTWGKGKGRGKGHS